jgi:two-component system chemotaxis response regulator CheY
MGRILEQGGFEVIGEAENGREAVEKYRLLRPDLVTMDIVMREIGGVDAVRAIREFDAKARILVCSAMAQQSLIAEVLAAGAKHFLLKPFQPSHLLEAAEHALA